ncbi:MAG: chromosome partitioning protein ParB [Ruminococcaceae bacterium]|nr:chromosome partitioning protein ParB [Oscillospiraceae bacterium]
MLIKIEQIVVKPRRREIDEKHVEELAKSIKSLSLLNPITVDQDYTLIAGLHRLEAVKLLGYSEIECNVTSLDGLRADLAELDENLIRKELSTLDFDELMQRRKEIYEALNPTTRWGGDHKSEKNKSSKCALVLPKSFADDTAAKTGLSKSTIKRRVQAAKHMIPEAKQILRQGNVDITKTDALRLSKLPPEQQIVAATQFSEGKISTLRGYQADDSEETENDSAESEQQDDNAPFHFSNKCFSDFKESVADLKDPEKDCSCSTGSFLAEVTSSVKQIHKIIECYSTPYYMAVFPELDEKQTDYLKDLLESVGDAAMQLYNSITERTSFDGKS